MVTLKTEKYSQISHLITSKNELSVFSVLNGNMPGTVSVNNADHPTAVLVQTSEANLLAGSTQDEEFNRAVTDTIDFWGSLTPDSEEWIEKIPTVHRNKYIREYTRRKYSLSNNQFIQCNRPLPEGYFLEDVNLSELRKKDYVNANRIFGWAEAWGSEENFALSGCGYYIRKNNVIISWSLSDCAYKDRIAIGVHTDPQFRKQGFGLMVVSAVVQSCLNKGYKTIEWLCVETNRGSQAIAEKLGFTLENKYSSFSSYAPIENLNDMNEAGWYEWGEYLEAASQKEPKLYQECLHCFIKANSVEKAIDVINQMSKKNIVCKLHRLKDNILNYQSGGLSSEFNNQTWLNYIKSLEESFV